MRLNKTFKTIVMLAAMAAPSFVYAQAYGTVATETLNVRAGAKIDAPILEQIGLGSPVEIVSRQDDWLKLILEDDTRAYVKQEYINVHRALAVVDVNGGLNVRDYPSKEMGEIIGKFQPGDEISVGCRVGDWYKVSQEGFEGYVHKDYVKSSSEIDFLGYLPIKKITEVERATVTQEEALAAIVEAEKQESAKEESAQKEENKKEETLSNNQSSSNSSSSKPESKPQTKPESKPQSKPESKPQSKPSNNGSTTGQAVVNYASQFLGNPYVYGGNSLTNGIDCSGFTSQVMKKFGISLNRSSAAQYANNGYSVSSSNLQPGDLLFYGYSGQVSHVAIYMGNGRIIHANDERTGICTGNAFPSRGKPYIGAKRVL